MKLFNLFVLAFAVCLLVGGPVLLLVYMDRPPIWWASGIMVLAGAIALYVGMRAQEMQRRDED